MYGRVVIDCEEFHLNQKREEIQFATNPKAIEVKDCQHIELGENELMLCSPTLPGFTLTQKRWGHFNVAEIKDIEFNAKAFDNLVLPEEKKAHSMATIRSSIARHAITRSQVACTVARAVVEVKTAASRYDRIRDACFAAQGRRNRHQTS